MDIVKLQELYNTGISNREIAKELSCNHRTVATHLDKLGLKSLRVSSSVKKNSTVTKICSKCNTLKGVEEYQRGRRGQEYEYEFSYCNSCRRSQSYNSLNNSFESYLKDRLRRWKSSALKSSSKFELDYEYITELYTLQHGKCFYTEVELVWGVKTKSRDIISLDKISPSLGYIKDNVVLCTNRANTIKSDQTLEEMKKWMPDWYVKINNRKTLHKI